MTTTKTVRVNSWTTKAKVIEGLEDSKERYLALRDLLAAFKAKYGINRGKAKATLIKAMTVVNQESYEYIQSRYLKAFADNQWEMVLGVSKEEQEDLDEDEDLEQEGPTAEDLDEQDAEDDQDEED